MVARKPSIKDWTIAQNKDDWILLDNTAVEYSRKYNIGIQLDNNTDTAVYTRRYIYTYMLLDKVRNNWTIVELKQERFIQCTIFHVYTERAIKMHKLPCIHKLRSKFNKKSIEFKFDGKVDA